MNMNKKGFDRLLESVREVGKIRRGELAPSRVYSFDEKLGAGAAKARRPGKDTPPDRIKKT
jgi:hypothetical protein